MNSKKNPRGAGRKKKVRTEEEEKNLEEDNN